MKTKFLGITAIALAIADGIVLYMHHQYKENTKLPSTLYLLTSHKNSPLIGKNVVFIGIRAT